MIREELVAVCTCEMSGRVRGKAFPAHEWPARQHKGVGWVPTNSMINAFGSIAATPFGTAGDLVLLPDPATRVRVDFDDASPVEHFYLGDLRHLDGTPWECCPRDFLRRALAALREVAGLRLLSAFEHEFVYTGIETRPGGSYALDSLRRQGAFAEVFTAALRAAGCNPDTFLPEYGPGQFEFTCDPALGVASADRAVVAREMARATAHRLGQRAVFAPILDPAGVGNGVHIHFSFQDMAGVPATHDPAAPDGMTAAARHFVAGILHHLPALCAITAPSVVSYLRLRPNRWAPTHASLARQDRAAAVRICPIQHLPAVDAAHQFNIEYRVADATASPYLALGALVWAGVEGLRHRMALPVDAPALPASLDAALTALDICEPARDWFGPTHLAAYLMHKRGEAAQMAGLDEQTQCNRYVESY